MNRIKVAIIDDNDKVLTLIRELIESESDIVICAEAKNLYDAREIIENLKPDVIILDLSLDVYEGGLKLLNEIPTLNESAKVIILSAHDERNYGPKSFQAGAKGYVCKDKIVGSLIDVVRAVYGGKEYGVFR